MGRPTEYQEDYPKKAFELCRFKGFNDKKLAKHFRIAECTLYEWKNRYPEFAEWIKRGKREYDNEHAVDALKTICFGKEYWEVTKERGHVPMEKPNPDDPDGEPITVGVPKMVTTKKVKKYLFPNIRALEFYLCNRNPDDWKHINQLRLGFEGGGMPGDNQIEAIIIRGIPSPDPNRFESIPEHASEDIIDAEFNEVGESTENRQAREPLDDPQPASDQSESSMDDHSKASSAPPFLAM